MQIVFAQNWPVRIWLAVVPATIVVLAIRTCEPSLATFRSWQAAGPFLVVLVISPILGYFTAVLFGAFFFAPIYQARGQLNGGPFKVGDVVQVLAGPHRGTVTKVYSLWQGDSVRVRLGQTEEETFKDVMQPAQLLREADAEPATAPYSEPAARSPQG